MPAPQKQESPVPSIHPAIRFFESDITAEEAAQKLLELAETPMPSRSRAIDHGEMLDAYAKQFRLLPESARQRIGDAIMLIAHRVFSSEPIAYMDLGFMNWPGQHAGNHCDLSDSQMAQLGNMIRTCYKNLKALAQRIDTSSQQLGYFRGNIPDIAGAFRGLIFLFDGQMKNLQSDHPERFNAMIESQKETIEFLKELATADPTFSVAATGALSVVDPECLTDILPKTSQLLRQQERPIPTQMLAFTLDRQLQRTHPDLLQQLKAALPEFFHTQKTRITSP